MSTLFWLVFKKGSDISVVIQPGGSLIFARLKVAVAGIEGEFQEGHELDDKMAKKVPKAQTGKGIFLVEVPAIITPVFGKSTTRRFGLGNQP